MKIGMRSPRRRHEDSDTTIEVAKATAAESFFQPPDHGDEPRRDEWVFMAQGTPGDWECLVSYTEHMRFKKGETVIRAGEVDRSLYFVTDGRLDLMLPQPNGAERLVRTISAPAVIGEMGFVEHRMRSMTIKGMTDGDLLRLDYEAFERLSEEHPQIAHNLLFELARVLSLRLRWATQALACGWQ
jgi:signal-transduction protein with cAMP-binding, CBS, and nucleotidyltransferase domain